MTGVSVKGLRGWVKAYTRNKVKACKIHLTGGSGKVQGNQQESWVNLV